MTGGLHLIFGDSSVGEAFWDGGWVRVMAMLSFHITRRFAGLRWGRGAAAMTGRIWNLPGRFLTEVQV